MAQVNAGRVRFIGRGEYDNSTQYYTFDLVNYNGNSYFAKSNTMGNLPTNSTYWQLVAEKGNIGPAGPTGNGIDHISLTSQSGATKVYTIYYTDGTTSEYTVQDGEVTQEVFDEEVDRLKMIYNAMPKVSGEGTDLTLNNTAECPVYDIESSPSELSQETTTGKNKLPILDGTITANGITITVENGVININGTSTAGTNFKLTNGLASSNSFNTDWLEETAISEKTNTTISKKYVSGSGATGNSAFRVYGTTDTYLTQFYPTTAQGEETYSESGKISCVVFFTTNGRTFDNYKFTIQDEDGSTVTDFEKFTYGASPNPQYPQEIHTVSGENTITISNSDNTQSQTYPLSLADLEYCKIGDYEDEFYKATESDTGLTAGKWYLKKNIGKVVLNGSESGWLLDTGSTAQFGLRKNDLKRVNTQLMVMSDYFKGVTYSSSWNAYNYLISTNTSTSSAILIKIKYPDISTLEDFKTWLSEHNPTVYYVLATPENILLSDTLQTQLDNIQKALSYQEQTNVSQTNNDLPFVIKMSAIRDLSGIFDLISQSEEI